MLGRDYRGNHRRLRDSGRPHPFDRRTDPFGESDRSFAARRLAVMEYTTGYSKNLVLEEIESTNDYARNLGEEGLPHGTWISTRIQTQGRGRLGREWRSSEGNLFLSIV